MNDVCFGNDHRENISSLKDIDVHHTVNTLEASISK